MTMPLGRTAIEWAQNPDGSRAYSWNPVSGCRNGCSYCWAARMVKRFPAKYPHDFEPTFHSRLLDSNLYAPAGSTVLTCIMGDLFSEGVAEYWQKQVSENMATWPEPTYLLLTKRPDLVPPGFYQGIGEHPYLWLGTSVESGAIEHYRRIGQLRRVEVAHRFVSFEPLLDETDVVATSLKGMDWVIIGAQTGPGAKPPKIEWIANIIEAAGRADVPVFVKDNAQGLAPELFAPYRALPYLKVQP